MILVVDDDDAAREASCRVLKRDGLTALGAGGGDQAMAALQGEGVEVVLLDVEMPDTTGLDLLTWIHAQPALVGVPVILLTGRAASQDIVDGLEHGAYDYLVKPVQPAELTARVRAALRTRDVITVLERRNVELDQYAQTAAHDLKSPLGIIRSAADLLGARWSRLPDETRADLLAEISAAAIRAAAMIDDLLALSRFDDKADAIATTEAPREVAEDVVAAALLKPGDSVDIRGDWAGVAMAEVDLRAALTNLVGNASVYGRSSDGQLAAVIAGRQDGAALVIEVSDSGPGIAEAERMRIFEAFYSVPGSREINPASSGVGLAIVKRAVERCGGSAECLPAEPTGTMFRLTVPKSTDG